MPGEDVPVVWEVATGEDFATTVASGVATASPDHAHAVHVDVTGLTPASTYWYRFRVGPLHQHRPDAPSRCRAAGRAGDHPGHRPRVAARTTRPGFYAAHRDIAAQQPDLVVWLGDYIYEGGADADRRRCARTPRGESRRDLDGYRDRYAPVPRPTPTCRPRTAPRRGSSSGTTTRSRTTTPATPRGRRPQADFRARRRRRVPGVVGAPAGAPRRHRSRAPSYRIYRTRRGARWPASSCSTVASTAATRRAATRAVDLEPACPETCDAGRARCSATSRSSGCSTDARRRRRRTWNVIGNQTVARRPHV